MEMCIFKFASDQITDKINLNQYGAERIFEYNFPYYLTSIYQSSKFKLTHENFMRFKSDLEQLEHCQWTRGDEGGFLSGFELNDDFLRTDFFKKELTHRDYSFSFFYDNKNEYLYVVFVEY